MENNSEDIVKRAELLSDNNVLKYDLLKEAIEIDNNAWANILMIKLLENKKNFNEIINYIENLKKSLDSERWRNCEITKKTSHETIESYGLIRLEHLENLAKEEKDEEKSKSLYEQKKELIRNQIEKNPSESIFYVKLAELIDKKEKIELLKKAIEIDNNAWANILMIKFLIEKSHTDAEIEDYVENLKISLEMPRWEKCESTKKEAERVIKEFNRIKSLKIFFEEEIKKEKKFKKIHGEGKNILYLSPEAPRFDQSSGGNRLLEIIKIIRGLSYNVYFFTSYVDSPDHVVELEKIGVKVFSDYLIHEEELLKLKNNNIKFNSVIFSWWETGLKYISLIKSMFPEATIISDSVDVHWLREHRAGTGTVEKKEKEKLVYMTSDVVFAVTEDDKKEIVKECKSINVKILSNIHREERNEFKDGNDIIFVGGFNHPANLDAALICCKCFKEFLEKTKTKSKLYIVGHNPPEELKKLASDDIVITGYVRDISEYYEKAKVLFAPLTWGAGIKGKICQSAMNRVPIITTDVGNEGINFIHKQDCLIANKEEEFIDCLCQIYNYTHKELELMAKNAFEKIKNLTSESNANIVLENCFAQKPVVISILTYNNSKILEKCIRSLHLNTSYSKFKILVIDNASTDDTEVVMNRLISEMKEIDLEYIKNKKNEFFIKPNNRIMKKYEDCDIVLLNDDVEIISKCWLSHLNNAAYSSADISCAGGKVINANGTLAEAGCYLNGEGIGAAIGYGDDPRKDEYNFQKYVGYCSGCMLYIRRDAINKVGLLDENYDKMYYEESDWQYRSHILGLKTIYEPKCAYVHFGQMTSKDSINEYMEKNRKKFKEKFKDKNIEQYNGH
jgi:GT2 family glycosyltransferase